MDSLLLIVLAIALILGVIMLAGVGRINRKRSGLDRAYYQKQWSQIESFKTSGGAGWNMAVFEADKLLDHALKARGFNGDTMGERLKSARGSFMNNDSIWQAHKLRNRLAHEHDVPLNAIVVDKALRSFRAALKDLGAF